MQAELRNDYARIGRERDEAGRDFDRARRWFFVRVGAACWAWTILGGVIMAQGFHVNATVGAFYYPDLMERAWLWVNGGVLVGTAGSLGTLIWGWRTAGKRGYVD